jgi:tetratricopeptide (TPR) repeat protein
MKHLLLILIIFTTKVNAQQVLNFDKRFVQSEDKWVAFQPEKNGSYAFGFIYIDAQAGLTLNHEGTFRILANGEFLREKGEDSTKFKIRLQPNNVLVAHIPENKFDELKITPIPDWLHFYKSDTSSVQRLFQWGYMDNGWSECAKALTYLERAKDNDPNFRGLAVEIAFSYNCLKQYTKAEEILEAEIKKNPADAYVNKEFIYTLVQSDKIEKAITQFNSSLNLVKDKQYHAENAYNILQYFYIQKDKENFSKWYEILMKQPTENKMITDYANKMKNNMNNRP